MHAVEQITSGDLLALIFGLALFIVIAWLMFRPKRKK